MQSIGTNKTTRLLLVEVDGSQCFLHAIACATVDAAELDQHANEVWIPDLAQLVTRGGSVTSVAYLEPTLTPIGRFMTLAPMPTIATSHSVTAYTVTRRVET